MGVRSAREVGAILRGARSAARLTQAQVGAACGYSPSAISRIEAGLMRVEYARLLQLAAAVGVAPDRLTDTSGPHTSRLGTVERPDDEEDPMRRRTLLQGAVAAGAASVVGPTPAEAAPPPPDLETVLYRLPPAGPVPMAQLLHDTTKARGAFRGARYSALGQDLPHLLATASATRDAAAGGAREQASALLARAYVLAAELGVKQHHDAAWVAADRALAAARDSGQPVAIGEAARVLAITMRRSGRPTAAVQLLTREAGKLDPGQERTGAVRTTLLLTAAYSAATAADRTTALDLLDAAEEDTARHNAAVPGLFTVEATRPQVDVYRIGIYTALGTPDEGVPVARRIDIDRMPTPERRARAWTDTARMWHALGDGPRTFAALRQVEQEAPQEAQRPALRALTAGLLYGPSRLPGLREFASRNGAVIA